MTAAAGAEGDAPWCTGTDELAREGRSAMLMRMPPPPPSRPTTPTAAVIAGATSGAAAGATAIQGEEGSNSALAARALLGDDVTFQSCASFAEVFHKLDAGEAVRAVLPVENTTAGLVQEVWDRLLGLGPGPALAALREARVRISFVAACLPGSRARVKKIFAHPVAAAQSRRFLSSSGLAVLPCHDTAGAARLVREGHDPEVAALCPPGAADAWGLELLASDCGDETQTVTRFLLVEPGEARPAPEDDRVLLALRLADRPGALAVALSAVSTAGLNLCALHSRAIPGQPGRYAFLLEVETGALDPRLGRTLAELASAGADVRLLGSFRAPAWPDEARRVTT